MVRGSGALNGQPSLVRQTGLKGLARTVFSLGPEAGINNHAVTASCEGLTTLPATFVVSGLLPGNPANTTFQGVIVDNALTPIPDAEVTIPGTALITTTGNQGQFFLQNVLVGYIHLRIDPTNSPRPETFPPLAFETVTVAGQPIMLPVLQMASSQLVGGNQDVTLNMPGVAGLALTVLANSVTCPNSAMQCQVTISQVQLDKVPMPPPNGSLFRPLAWTIQPLGVEFNPPARITIPNDGLPPGRVVDIFQFDPTLNEFINVGKGTVSEDAALILSDPGFGMTRAGLGRVHPAGDAKHLQAGR